VKKVQEKKESTSRGTESEGGGGKLVSFMVREDAKGRRVGGQNEDLLCLDGGEARQKRGEGNF